MMKPRRQRIRFAPCRQFFWLAFSLLGLAALEAQARINVVTLPDRDTVQLTIYNSADLTLVKETRVLTFRKGINKLEFSWANTLIDPTSVEFRPLTHADQVDVLDVSFPPRVAHTLEWRIQSDFAGEVQVEIRYFTSGITWAADYVAEAGRDEKAMDLAGAVRVTNRSGEGYENAQVRLVVGVIRLVESIVDLSKPRSGRRDNKSFEDGALAVLEDKEMFQSIELGYANGAVGGGEREQQKRKEIVKQGLSEYFLYTVEGRDTILNGWAKRLPSFAAKSVPITSYYKFEREQWGDQVMRYYQFTNSVASKLGTEPLPDGAVKAFRFTTDDKLYAFVGRTSVKYIPVNEAVEMELGADAEVLVKPVLMNWTKTDLKFDPNGHVQGWTIKEIWQVEAQNTKDIDVMLDVRRNFSGDWTLVTDAKYEKVDATKVKFVLPLKAREKQTFTYELTTRHGSSVTK